jgi:hypothetical protein
VVELQGLLQGALKVKSHTFWAWLFFDNPFDWFRFKPFVAKAI